MTNNKPLTPVCLTDQNYLGPQYKTDVNLSARQRVHERFSTNPQGIFSWLMTLAEVQLGQVMLDVGCGNGRLWQDILNEGAKVANTASYDVTLVDLSLGMVQQAAQVVDKSRARWQAIQASATNLPFSGAYFERVFANYMLYHVPDVDQAVTEFRRVLHPEGKLCVTLLGQAHMGELWQLLQDLLKTQAHSREGRFLAQQAQPDLEKHFAQVQVHPYDDALQVTDAAMLWDYVLSSFSLQALSVAELADLKMKFQAAVQEEIERTGHFYIQKDTVVFVCW